MQEFIHNCNKPVIEHSWQADSANKISDYSAEEISYTNADISRKACHAVVEWVETAEDDLDESETLQDRLLAILSGIADQDGSGDLSEDEYQVADVAFDAAVQFMTHNGVTQADAELLIYGDDTKSPEVIAEVAERVQEKLAAALPTASMDSACTGDDLTSQKIDDFVFGDKKKNTKKMSTDSANNQLHTDATYKWKTVFHNGIKEKVRKHVAGFIHKTAKQKMAIQKMLRKAHSGIAKLHRRMSMRKRKAAGF